MHRYSRHQRAASPPCRSVLVVPVALWEIHRDRVSRASAIRGIRRPQNRCHSIFVADHTSPFHLISDRLARFIAVNVALSNVATVSIALVKIPLVVSAIELGVTQVGSR